MTKGHVRMAKTKKLDAEQLEKQVEKVAAKLAELEESRDEIEAQIEAKKTELESATNAWKACLWDDYQAGLEKRAAAISSDRGDEIANGENTF